MNEIQVLDAVIPTLSRPDDFEVPILVSENAEYSFDRLNKRAAHLLVRGATYEEPLIHKDKTFPQGISFVDVVFEKEVNFNRCVFDGPLYFWNCRFEHKASFFRMLVTGKCHPVQLRLAGEVNFSYSRFEHKHPGLDRPSFDRAQFSGIAFFHRTVFCNGVSMEEVRFEGGARFDGSRSDICVTQKLLRNAFFTDAVLSDLTSKTHRILSSNKDHEEHYDFNRSIRSEENLKKRLAKIDPTFAKAVQELSRPRDIAWVDGFAGSIVQTILVVWRQGFSSTMFGGIQSSTCEVPLTSFKGAQFARPSSFSRLELGMCSFLGVNVADIDFTVVEWARRPCGLLMRHLMNDFRRCPWLALTDRAALRDEIDLDEDEVEVGSHNELRNRRQELSELYRELRIAYDREGDIQTGRDFYFGEVEAERMSYRNPRRSLGLSNCYRLLSGYSKREGLALSWLLAFIFVIFPIAFYLFIGRPERQKLLTPAPVSLSHAPDTSEGCQIERSLMPTLGDLPDRTQYYVNPQFRQDRYDTTLNNAIAASWGNGTPKSLALRAITSSLEASTFLPTSGEGASIRAAIQTLESVRCSSLALQHPYTDAATAIAGLEGHKRALEALERLIVPAQLGLFLLALRSKFQRTR